MVVVYTGTADEVYLEPVYLAYVELCSFDLQTGGCIVLAAKRTKRGLGQRPSERNQW